MVFFINIYGRAADPPDKDKGNQNDMVNNNSRYLRASNVLRKHLPNLVLQLIGCSVLTWWKVKVYLDVLDVRIQSYLLSNDLSRRHHQSSQKWSNVANISTSGVFAFDKESNLFAIATTCREQLLNTAESKTIDRCEHTI